MSNTEYRAVIKFFAQKGLRATKITKELAVVYRRSAPSYGAVAKSVVEFNDPTQTFEDAPRSGRPSTTLTEESIRAVEEVVMCVIDNFLCDACLMNWPSRKHHSNKS